MRPPITTAHCARPRSTASTRSRTRPSSISTSWPGSSTSPITAGAIGSSPSVANSSAQIVIVLAADEHDRLVEIADPELRALEVGDQRDRTADFGLDRAHPPRPLRVILVRPVREVQPRGIHARGDERAQLLGRVGRRTERRDDLRSACRDHGVQTSHARGGRRPSPDTLHGFRALPRCAAAGCTSRRGRSARARRS